MSELKSSETPQQPELTPDDRHRIETEVIRITGGYTKESSDTYLSCFKAAEYATLNERAAAQARFDKDEDYRQLKDENIKLLLAQKGNLARLDELNDFVKKVWELLEIPTSLIFKETANGVHLIDILRGLKEENNELRKLTDELLP